MGNFAVIAERRETPGPSSVSVAQELVAIPELVRGPSLPRQLPGWEDEGIVLEGEYFSRDEEYQSEPGSLISHSDDEFGQVGETICGTSRRIPDPLSVST